MGSFSIWHWIIILAVVLILFGGRGKISELMGDVGKGIGSFRKGLDENKPNAQVTQQTTPPPVPSPEVNSKADAPKA